MEANVQEFQHKGYLVLKGFLTEEPTYLAFVEDVIRLLKIQFAKNSVPYRDDLDFHENFSVLAKHNRKAVGAIYDLGTRPSKLVSAQKLKYCQRLLEIVEAIFRSRNPELLLGTPAASDTLHIFPPGAENYRHNLPVHQDYPYLLQSPQQLTVWFNLGITPDDTGGVEAFQGSNRLGVQKHLKNATGVYEAVMTDELEKCPLVRVDVQPGDLVVFDSLTQHRSVVNSTPDQTRVTQIFRYSNLCCDESLALNWQSSEATNSYRFETAHPELFVPT